MQYLRQKEKPRKTRDIKYFWKYQDAMPETEHRRRLLNRLSAARGRCENEKNRMYRNYGGRGIAVCDEWKKTRPLSSSMFVASTDGTTPSEMDRTGLQSRV